MSRSKVTVLFAVVVLMMAQLACGLFSSTSEPPHYGVFLREGNDFVEMSMFEAFGGEPEPEELAIIPVTKDRQPDITFWDPNVVPVYLGLFANGGRGQQVAYTISPGDAEGTLDMQPSGSLPPDDYCFVQGDPLGMFLRTWCFGVR